jgi:NAD(P)-dependent dehydrogenase (short-subunit alcohol dehydrogenase family)
MDPKNKVVFLVGASNGIGLASARALARAGARVVLGARSRERLDDAVAAIVAGGGAASAVALDVTSDASVRAAVEEVVATAGRIDVVVNFAGNGGALGAWAAAGAGALRDMFEVHVFGAERVARAVLPIMTAQRSGTIVNIASTVAWVPMPMAAAYSSAKAAIVAFSHALRAELEGSGIRVMVFSPPHTNTEAGRAWPLRGPQVFEPDQVAAELLRALRRDRRTFLAGMGNRMLLVIQRIWPWYAAFIMKSIGLAAHRRVQAQLAAPK